MARRRRMYQFDTQRIRIRLRGVIIQTCDTYGEREKKTKGAPTSSRRHSRVIDLRRHAARTATAVERATAHVHSHVRGWRCVISPHTTHARAQARPMATPVERGVSE